MPPALPVVPIFVLAAKWGGAALLLIALFVLPVVSMIGAALALIGQSVLLALSASGREQVRRNPAAIQPDISCDVFLSVHVPACREPAEVLIGTLAALRDQRPRVPHEIIVIVNNTPDPAQWQPIEDWCARAGAPFRFLRRDGVAGAKAGALNIALALCDERTTHVVTIDADYQVDAEFLRDASVEISAGDSAFYQYPQAYRNVTRASDGIARELEDYFKRQALAANLGQAMLLTGTLSVISKDALRSVGGWPTSSCTEDAALGTLLIDAGYHGVYVDRVVGRGLMPLDVAGLHKQRHRWASGNARVLVQFMRGLLRNGTRMDGGSTFRRVLIVSQLTAWLNLGAIAAAMLCVGMWHLAMADVPSGSARCAQTTLWLSVMTLLASVGSAVPLLANGPVRRELLSIRITAFWSRIAMLPVAAWATVVGLLPVAQRFQVTPKAMRVHGGQTVSVPVLISSCLGAIIIGTSLFDPRLAPLVAGIVMLFPLIGSVASARALTIYAKAAA